MIAQPNRPSVPIWRKSSASGTGANCVEVASFKSSVLVRDTIDRHGTILTFTPAQWRSFVRGIKNGDSRRD